MSKTQHSPAAARPGFVRTSKAWYAATALEAGCTERLFIANYCGQQTIGGEVVLEWTDRRDTPELRVHHDGFEVLNKVFSGLLRHLAHAPTSSLNPDAICALLERLGYADRTELERPPNVAHLRRRHP